MMTAFAAIAAYLIATLRLIRHVYRPGETGHAGLFVGGIGTLLHFAVHGDAWRVAGAPDLHFFAALSLVGLGMAALTLLAPFSRRLDALGVVVFPIAATTLLLYALFGRSGVVAMDWRIQLHAFLALLAYAALALAALLAILLWLQEHALRQRRFTGLLRALPPLTQLETLLFRTIGAGFGLLTLALVSGVLFVEDLLAQHLAHKTVLSALAWLVFGGLLLGRWRYGWRGRRAVRLTLLAMCLLGLAFFGSKFVLEILLRRG
ncbi:cytochrome C assembly family protein [Rehaibacterium terrae]|nr:cytochrome c biogenesis protein CcsA [Rehaibacterium terrae]